MSRMSIIGVLEYSEENISLTDSILQFLSIEIISLPVPKKGRGLDGLVCSVGKSAPVRYNSRMLRFTYSRPYHYKLLLLYLIAV